MSDHDYDSMVAALKLQVDPERRLPDWPFVARSGYVTIFEFLRIVGADFGGVLQSLADTYRDETIGVVSLDPDMTYFHDAFGHSAAFQLVPGDLITSYGDGMWHEPNGEPAGALVFSVDRLAIFGGSGCWSLWAERNWEVGLLLTPDEAGPWQHQIVPSFERSIDLASIRSPKGWGMPLTPDDIDRFRRNIEIRGSGRPVSQPSPGGDIGT